MIHPLFARLPWAERLWHSSLGRRLATGSFWVMVGTATSKALTWLSAILVARLVGPAVFGEFGVIQNTTNMLLMVASFNMTYTATKFVAEHRLHNPARAGRIMALSMLFSTFSGFLLTGAVYTLAPWLCDHMLHAPHLTALVRLAAFTILFGAVNASQMGALSGFEDFRSTATVNILSGLVGFPLVVGGAYALGLKGAVLGLAVQSAFICVANQIILRRCARRAGVAVNYRDWRSELPIILSFSLPGLLAGLVAGPSSWACAVMLVNAPDGYREMGLFSAANQLQIMVLYLSGILGAVALPMLSSLTSLEDATRFGKVLRAQVLMNGAITSASALAMSLLAGVIMSWYGPGFAEGRWVLVLLSVTSIMISVGGVYGIAIASLNRLWAGLILRLAWALVLLGIAWPAIRWWGATGLAGAMLVAALVHTVLQGWLVWRTQRLHFITPTAPATP